MIAGVVGLGLVLVAGCSLFQNRPPIAAFVAHPVPDHPVWVRLDATGTTDPEGDPIVAYAWIFGADQPGVTIITPLGFLTKTVPVPEIVVDYVTEGEYTITLVATDARGKASDPVVRTITLPLPVAD